jgi:hypothetical protein
MLIIFYKRSLRKEILQFRFFCYAAFSSAEPATVVNVRVNLSELSIKVFGCVLFSGVMKKMFYKQFASIPSVFEPK